MNFFKIKSYAKINLSLKVIRKLKSKLHRIESLVTFVNLFDEIQIKETQNKHKIIFFGKFSKNISTKNTINKLLNILDENKYLKDKKFLIKVKKNIPMKSGLGGGSMNAASILSYFLKKKFLFLKKKEINKISNLVGSDVVLGLKKKNTIISSDGRILRLNKSIGLHVLIVKPNFGCSTKKIYRSVRAFSKASKNTNYRKLYSISKIANLTNDLEKIAIKRHPLLHNLKKNLQNLPKVKFVRMTGSGSSYVAYFNSKKPTINAARTFKKKYKNYWSIVAKTI